MFEGNTMLGFKDYSKVPERIERRKMIMVIKEIKVYIGLFFS